MTPQSERPLKAQPIGLTNESRLIATPWSRMVRGLGLGQYPTGYERVAGDRIRLTFAMLDRVVAGADPYTRFSSHLANLVLRMADPEDEPSRDEQTRAINEIVGILGSIANPYFRVMAGCILMDAWAKLRADASVLMQRDIALPVRLVAWLNGIGADQIADENRGRHGDYERLSAMTAVLLAMGQAGFKPGLISGGRNLIVEALELLQRVPAPFFRGRGGSMLLSVIALLGYREDIANDQRDYLLDTLDYVERDDEIQIWPTFPQPMSLGFARIYPRLTMLNAMAVVGESAHLDRSVHLLKQIAALWEVLRPVERTHMGLYYIVGLHNLGALRSHIPDLDCFVEKIVGTWQEINPGSDYFLNGISYAYIIQTAMITSRRDLIVPDMLNRLVDSFIDFNHTHVDRVNSPYPFSYNLNVMAELGELDYLFEPRRQYEGRSPTEWVVDNLERDASTGDRLYMLNNALISYALRQRDKANAETKLFQEFRFCIAEAE